MHAEIVLGTGDTAVNMPGKACLLGPDMTKEEDKFLNNMEIH